MFYLSVGGITEESFAEVWVFQLQELQNIESGGQMQS